MRAGAEAPREDALLARTRCLWVVLARTRCLGVVLVAPRAKKAGPVARRRAVARSTWGIGESEQRVGQQALNRLRL